MDICGFCADPIDTRGNGPAQFETPEGLVSGHEDCGADAGLVEV